MASRRLNPTRKYVPNVSLKWSFEGAGLLSDPKGYGMFGCCSKIKYNALLIFFLLNSVWSRFCLRFSSCWDNICWVLLKELCEKVKNYLSQLTTSQPILDERRFLL